MSRQGVIIPFVSVLIQLHLFTFVSVFHIYLFICLFVYMFFVVVFYKEIILSWSEMCKRIFTSVRTVPKACEPMFYDLLVILCMCE
jgi:hypothetical protein